MEGGRGEEASEATLVGLLKTTTGEAAASANEKAAASDMRRIVDRRLFERM